MKLLRLPEMAAEVSDALAYYRAIDPELGKRFARELLGAISRIEHMPLSWKTMGQNCRRCAMKVFPYHVIYAIEGDAIVLIALANTHRQPDYWLSRTIG
jgi:ParE toxin of type II toxin-antitoxin system, parDE